MESSSSSNKKQQAANDAACRGKPARTHWRRRDPADTSVYVVHPAQFRAVVQQLTGADSSPPPAGHHHQGGGNGTTTTEAQQVRAAAAGMCTNDAQQLGRGEDQNNGRGGKTLGQIHDECMAWANADD